MTLMTLGTPWWVRLLVRVGLLREEPIAPRPAPLRAVIDQRAPLHVGPAGTAAWLALAQLRLADRERYFALHGALLKPDDYRRGDIDWGRA